MKASDELIEAIKGFEGCKLYAYRDSAGVKTIGYGTTRGVRMGMTITKEQAEAFLRRDVGEVEDQVNALGLNLKQNEFDALVDFAYNLGIGNLKSSTLLKYIKAGKTQLMIIRQFMAWVRSGGKVLNGLVKRRKWEAERYIGKTIYKADDGKWYIKKT